MVILDFIICIKQKSETSNRGLQPDLNPGLQWVGSQLSPIPTELFNLSLSEVIYGSAIDMIALRLKLKILCFPQKLSHGLQWVRQRAHHCTTEATTIHNNQPSIKRIYMTLKCMCVYIISLLFFFMTTNKKRQGYHLYFI